MSDRTDLRWIQAGIAAGLCASAIYPAILFAPLPMGAAAALAAFWGPAIGVGSLGVFFLLRLHRPSVAAGLGAVHNVGAGVLVSAMLLAQAAVKVHAPDAVRTLEPIWLGLDVAWDVYIGLGTLCFALAMRAHPRFGWPFAGIGLLLGVAVIVLNLLPFPMPPAAAGSVDVGPFVGLWYLAVTVQAWRSLAWARERAGAPAVDGPR